MYLGVIADDFTGAADIASFLVESGLRTIQFIGIPDDNMCADADAIVISLKSRSCPVDEAVMSSRAALRWLKDHGGSRYYFKYCSTFDSTDKGNIGPVTDALLADLGSDFTVVCPALPINGRTVYQGHLFVDGVLLNESGMRHHPITPMRDANLMRLMEAQATGKAENVPSGLIDKGADAVHAALSDMRDRGVKYAVLDTLNEAHLTTLGRAVAELPLVTGGSGLGAGIARALSSRLRHQPSAAATAGAPSTSGKTIVLSGSCSAMTNAQVSAYRAKAPAFELDVEHCLSDATRYAEKVAEWVLSQARASFAPMVYATTDPTQLALVQKAHGAEAASAAVERLFSRLTPLLPPSGFDHFIVAGGETSGIVVQSLGISGFHIGPQIAPGVPWVKAINRPLSLALKSGNFGDENFFLKAQNFYN